LRFNTSNPGFITKAWGGVGRNIAEVIARLGESPALISCVGMDGEAQQFFAYSKSVGIQTHLVQQSKVAATSTYMAVLDEKGDLCTTIADMKACDEITPVTIDNNASALASAHLVVLDANVSPATIDRACEVCSKHNVPVWFEPTGVAKSVRILNAIRRQQVTFISPSENELYAIAAALDVSIGTDTPASSAPHATFDAPLQVLADHKLPYVILTIGARGVLISAYCTDTSNIPMQLPGMRLPHHIRIKRNHVIVHIEALQLPSIVNTSGAGDSLVGGCVWALGAREQLSLGLQSVARSVQCGIGAAAITLQSDQSVSHAMSATTVLQALK
jgi:sugar/nucleoside kinase (ribokinase family)